VSLRRMYFSPVRVPSRYGRVRGETDVVGQDLPDGMFGRYATVCVLLRKMLRA
jgi:hypothetical protein